MYEILTRWRGTAADGISIDIIESTQFLSLNPCVARICYMALTQPAAARSFVYKLCWLLRASGLVLQERS